MCTGCLPEVSAPVPRLPGGGGPLPDHVQLGVQADTHLVAAGLLEGGSVAQRAQHRHLHTGFIGLIQAQCAYGDTASVLMHLKTDSTKHP